ncbi:MAG: DUF4118 domain-containing protein, partial [Terriglobales bacterium]
MHGIKQTLIKYLIAILVASAALLLRAVLAPLLGDQNPYHTVWLAIVFCAWYCGIGPSVLAVVICALGVWYWFVPPYHSFALKDVGATIFAMLGFLVFSAVIIALGEATRRIAENRRRAEEELREAHQELENRILEATTAIEQKTADLREKATLLDLANDAIFVKTTGGRITYWNRGAERLYGWTIQEALGRSSHELLHTDFPLPLPE